MEHRDLCGRAATFALKIAYKFELKYWNFILLGPSDPPADKGQRIEDRGQ